MNGVVKFRLCTLTNDQLLKKLDKKTDQLYSSNRDRVLMRNIPARPDDDYDLLVGELILRFNDLINAEEARDWRE